ncbi:HvfC/BufC N-terminal domain-containing protein [Neotabrizicola shimadae]|uniref:HvfC/BufC N-terminal domain-containing protein n=1 Tax=Neotabrizicola shimadae TaxID=2807096 RepID=UPI002877751D|nr:DNA-binding domain-containing protein [Neotabrizicola shimadae]
MPRDLVGEFRAGLFGGTLPAGVTARDPAEAERRFAVYRNNVAYGLTRALAARFPVVERLVGAEFFGAMARVFIEAHPPRSPVLFHWGGAFPGFLERFPPVAGLPYLPEVARLEWLRGEAYHAADARPVTAGDLAAAAGSAGGLRIGLHPSLRLFRSRFSAVTIWAANQPGAEPSGPLTADRAEAAAVLRDTGDAVPVLPVTAGDLVLVETLAAGGTLMAAAAAAALAEPGHAPGTILLNLARHGAIISLRQDDLT